MAYQSAKKSFARDEIVEILQKNVELYKGDPNFTSYIVDLTLYLVEYAYKRDTEHPVFSNRNVDFVSSGPEKMYKVFRSTSSGDTNKFCPFCGAPISSKAGKCSQCGNVI